MSASSKGTMNMGRRDELIARYKDDLRNKCGIEPDMALLNKVTTGCGPAIYDAEAGTIADDQPQELEAVRKSYLVKKLGLSDGPHLTEAINAVIEAYGPDEPKKYRPVVYYMLCKHFGKESAYR